MNIRTEGVNNPRSVIIDGGSGSYVEIDHCKNGNVSNNDSNNNNNKDSNSQQ